MRRMIWSAAVAGTAWLFALPVTAQQTTETFDAGTSGMAVYKTYCAVCHGKEANGDGPLAANLRHAPPDLTTLAKRNEGQFDGPSVHRIIDGRDPIKGHGGPDMPVWGDAFKNSADGHSEKAVTERIDALVEYLKTLQHK